MYNLCTRRVEIIQTGISIHIHNRTTYIIFVIENFKQKSNMIHMALQHCNNDKPVSYYSIMMFKCKLMIKIILFIVPMYYKNWNKPQHIQAPMKFK